MHTVHSPRRYRRFAHVNRFVCLFVSDNKVQSVRASIYQLNELFDTQFDSI